MFVWTKVRNNLKVGKQKEEKVRAKGKKERQKGKKEGVKGSKKQKNTGLMHRRALFFRIFAKTFRTQ